MAYKIKSQLNLYDLEVILGNRRVRVKFDDDSDTWTVELIGYDIDWIMLNTVALSREQYQVLSE